MKLKRNGIALFLLAALLCAALAGTAAADNITAEIPVEIILSGDLPNPPETFTVILKRNESWYPMPAGSEGDTCSLQITGSGADAFVIPCPGTGVFKYTIWQEPGSHSRGKYDPIIYSVTVTVINDETTGGLKPVVAIHRPDMEEKPDSCFFENSYSPQQRERSPKTDDNSDIRFHLVLTCASASVLLLLFLTRKRKHVC